MDKRVDRVLQLYVEHRKLFLHYYVWFRKNMPECDNNIYNHLEELNKTWKQINCKTIHDVIRNMNSFFSMKQHHTYINGSCIDNEQWKSYINKGLEFRCSLMSLTHEMAETV